jgi:hypothetical protein
MMLLTIGDRVSQGTYGVHSRFRRVVNFRKASGMVSVVDSTVGAGPVNIVAEGIDFGHARELRVESTGVVLDGVRFGFDGSAVYRSRMGFDGSDPRILRRNLPVLRDALLKTSSRRSLAFLLDPARFPDLRPGFERNLAEHLRNGVRRIWAGDVKGGVRMVTGCGFGLTPSGDDFISGMLIGLRVAGQVCGMDVEHKIETIYRAARTENFVSRNFLLLAYQGCVDARLKALVSALVLGDRAMTRMRAESVISVGETSGADTLTGLLMTLERNA